MSSAPHATHRAPTPRSARTRQVGNRVDPEIVARLSLSVTRLARVLRQHQNAEWMTPAAAATFATIVRDGPIALGDLAEAERVSRSTMTKLVRKLEQDGVIMRSIDPIDRRVHRVRLSDDGRRNIGRHRRSRNMWLNEQLEELADDDLDRLLSAVEVLERLTATEGPDPVDS